MHQELKQGWRILAASAFGIAFGISPVPFNMIGHIAPGLQADSGWPRGAIMLAVTVVGLTNAAMTPLFGIAIDRFGVRRVAIPSLVLFAICWLSLSVAPLNLTGFYAIWTVMGLVGGASQPISWTRAVNAWFDEKRGFALGVALTGTGIAGFVLNAAAPILVSRFGWRGAVAWTALPTLFIALPMAWLWIREPLTSPTHRVSQHSQPGGVTFGVAIRSRTFWIMCTSFTALALGYGGLYTNFVPLLIGKGIPAQTAGLVAGTIGVSLIVGRVTAGFLLDHVWAPAVAVPLLGAPAIACLLLARGGMSSPASVGAAVALGLAAGVESDLISYLAARYFGLRAYGMIYGILFGAFGVGSALSPPLYGWMSDAFGNYQNALVLSAALFCSSSMLLLFAGPYPARWTEGKRPRSAEPDFGQSF